MTISQILITGLPGVGKTTIIKKLANDLTINGIQYSGFYTEEYRNMANIRIGFNVKTFAGVEGVLARCGESSSKLNPNRRMLSKYCVHIDDFEQIIIPLFDNIDAGLLVIDEIGKMELFSRKFETIVKQLVNSTSNKLCKCLIATVPIKSVPIVDQLKNQKDSKIFIVTKENRSKIYNEILTCTLNMMKS